MKNINHIEIYENVLTSEQCEKIIRRFDVESKVALSNQFNPRTNKPFYYFLPVNPKTDPILSGPIQETILKYAYKHSFLIDVPTEWEIFKELLIYSGMNQECVSVVNTWKLIMIIVQKEC